MEEKGEGETKPPCQLTTSLRLPHTPTTPHHQSNNRACPDGQLFCSVAGRFPINATASSSSSATGLDTLGAACGQAGGVPLVVFGDHSSSGGQQPRAPTVVLSPMDTFMAANVVLERGEGAVLRYGVQGRVSLFGWVYVYVYGVLSGRRLREPTRSISQHTNKCNT